jgi:tRNA splicing endonuclease
MKNSVEELLALVKYLQSNFLSYQEIIEQAGVSKVVFDTLQAQGAVPKPSYQFGFSITCDSYFGEHTVPRVQYLYYAQGCVKWLSEVCHLKDNQAIYAHFKAEFLREYEALLIQGFYFKYEMEDNALDEYIREQFQHFIKGTYGLCTRTGRVAEIVRKEIAIATIQRLSRIADLTANDAKKMQKAIDLLDEASAYFTAHEYEVSTRAKYIDAFRR